MKTAAELIAQAKLTISELPAKTLAAQMAEKADLVIIDVREPSEFQQGCIPGAVNIPRGVLEFQVAAHPALACEPKAPELARLDRPIVVYCRSGGRSALAAQTLETMGFSQVYSLTGGILDWEAHQLAVAN